MRTFRMINTAEQHQISGLGFITTPDAFIPWRGVKVSGIVLFLKLMTLRNIRAFKTALSGGLIHFLSTLENGPLTAHGGGLTASHQGG